MSIEPLPGLKYQPISGDGHRLFNAVALYTGQTQKVLRNLVAARIEHDMGQYRQVIQELNQEKIPQRDISSFGTIN